MQRFTFVIVSILVLIAAPAAASANLKVVTTTSDLAAVAKEVGGDHVDVTALALPTQDPHFVDARPHLALALSRADLLLAVGLGLEVGWLPTLQTAARNGDIQNGGRGFLDLSRHVDLLEIPGGRVDRSQGDIHPGGNPHFLFDPRRMVRVAQAIADKLSELDPSHRGDYQAGARAFAQRVERARRGWEQRLSDLRGANVIAYHASFPYLADWIGFHVVEHVEPRPGIPPNPRHVASVLAAARARHVKVLLQESYYPESTSELIAGRSGARLVRLPGGPRFEQGQTYVDFMNRVVQLLDQATP